MRLTAQQLWRWCCRDYHSSPTRFVVELVAWSLSIVAAVLFAATVPQVPLITYLSITAVNCVLLAGAALHRGSMGLVINYVLLTALDVTALIRVVLAGGTQ